MESDAEKQAEALRESEEMVFNASSLFLSILLLTIEDKFISYNERDSL